MLGTWGWWLKTFFHLNSWKEFAQTHARTHTCRYKANNSDAWGYFRDNCVEQVFQSDFYGKDLSEEKSEPWVSGVHCTSERRWRVLRQGRVTAGRTDIKETMSPNGVEDIGSERCVKDFDNLFSFPVILGWSSKSQLYVILYYHIYFLLTESTYDLLKTVFKNGEKD